MQKLELPLFKEDNKQKRKRKNTKDDKMKSYTSRI